MANNNVKTPEEIGLWVLKNMPSDATHLGFVGEMPGEMLAATVGSTGSYNIRIRPDPPKKRITAEEAVKLLVCRYELTDIDDYDHFGDTDLRYCGQAAVCVVGKQAFCAGHGADTGGYDALYFGGE